MVPLLLIYFMIQVYKYHSIFLTYLAPFVFQLLSIIPFFYTPFLAVSLVFMLLYVWSREFPNANINIYGLVTLKVCS